MAYVAQSNFISGNVALQGKDIKLSFPVATDRNQDTVSYSLQYTVRPIYCNLVGGIYVCTNDTDNEIQSSWEVLSSVGIVNSIASITRTMPNYSTDMLLKYTIKATDGTSSGESTPISSGNIYLIRNVAPTLQISVVDWDSSNNIIVSGFITDLGFTHPANYSSVGGTTAWTNWRADLKYILDATDASPAADIPPATYSYYWAYGATIAELGTKIPDRVTGISYDFNLSKDWVADNTFSFTIANPAGASSSNSYYIKFYLQSSIFSGNVPYVQLLLNKMPIMKMTKGALRVNLPQSDIGKTGAVMASHGPQQSTDGDSVALYDHHTESGVTTEMPSLGFYKINHTKLARIGMLASSSDLEIKNLVTNGNIKLVPNGTGAIYLSGMAFPKTIGANGAPLVSNGTSIVWASTLSLLFGGTGATNASDARTNLGASAWDHTHDTSTLSGVLPLAGGAMTGTITRVIPVDTVGEILKVTMASNDFFRIAGGGASNAGYVEIATADDSSEPIYIRQYTGTFTTLTRTATLLDGSGNTSFPGTITAPTFSGALSGNASTATTLQTARTITIGNTGKPFNGSANATWTWAEMQVPRAYSAGYSFGAVGDPITTADFLTMLNGLGAFSQPYWIARGSWSYAGNQYINDTGCGNIHLAGAVVEVFGGSTTNCTIRITTPTTATNGLANSEFIYVDNGPTYSPGWRKEYNTSNLFYAATLPATGVEGQICLVPIA